MGDEDYPEPEYGDEEGEEAQAKPKVPEETKGEDFEEPK